MTRVGVLPRASFVSCCCWLGDHGLPWFFGVFAIHRTYIRVRRNIRRYSRTAQYTPWRSFTAGESGHLAPCESPFLKRVIDGSMTLVFSDEGE